MSTESHTFNGNVVSSGGQFVGSGGGLTNETVPRASVAVGTAYQIVINSGTGALSSEAYLSNTRGGTAQNSSAWAGIAHVVTGTWSASTIVNTDVATGAAIARSKLASGSINQVLINDGTGVMSSEAQLAASRGGMGSDTSAWTGIPHVAAGVWSASAIVNTDVAAGAAIARTKLASGTANQVVINDGTGAMSSEAQLAISRGGTGEDSTLWTGIVHVTAGDWTASTIVNTDVAAGAAIARSKLASGSINHVLINDGTGVMSSEAQLATSRGGTNLNTSASTGVPSVSAGTWSVNATLANTLGGTGINSSAWTGAPYVTAGTWSYDINYMSPAHGGTGQNTSGLTGVPYLTAGTWGVSATLGNTLGGTGQNSSAWSGIPYVTAGTWGVNASLGNTLGGTGANSSAWTGIAHVNTGVWSASAVVNADVGIGANIDRNKLASGTANYVVVNNGTGVMSEEQYLALSRGGTNAALVANGVTNVLSLAAAGTAVGLTQFSAANINSTLVLRGPSGELSIGNLTSTSSTINGGTISLTGIAAGVTTSVDAPTGNEVVNAYGTAITTAAGQTPAVLMFITTANYVTVVEIIAVITQGTAAGVNTGVIKLTQRFNRTTIVGTVISTVPTFKITDLDADIATVDIDLVLSGSNVIVRCKSMSEAETLYWQVYSTISHRAMSNI